MRLTKTTRQVATVHGYNQRHLMLTTLDGQKSINLLSTIGKDKASLATLYVGKNSMGAETHIDVTMDDLAELYQELRVLFELTDTQRVAAA